MMWRALNSAKSAPETSRQAADVCLIVEGCYPFISGGVSSWLDWLMRAQPDLTFSVVAIVSGHEPNLTPKYKFPPNLIDFQVISLRTTAARRQPSFDLAPERLEELAGALVRLLQEGTLDDLKRIHSVVNDPRAPLSLQALMFSRLSWELACHCYEQVMPHASFLHFYWAWRALFGGLFAVLKAPLPEARVYHTISTGYAGLFAARAALATGRPAAITEHGIYTNERRIEILMADWIADTVDKGIRLDDPRVDLRDVWAAAFNSYARICYEACDAITTLYGDNQRLQRNLGAAADRMSVIANGIKLERFDGLPVARDDDPPTMGLIARVVPIKDVKTFIAAAGIARKRISGLRALVMGPTDEDPAYFKECCDLVAELHLEDCVIFTGSVDIREYLPKLHCIVLSSLSEAQPLVLLEAGAAGVPCVATDVGSCREIIFGRTPEDRELGIGGAVTGLVAPDEIAAAVADLLENPELRRQQGQILGQRVRRYYTSEISSRSYAELYDRLFARESNCCAVLEEA